MLTPEQFAQIYDAYVEKIYRFLITKVNSPQTAQDLTSETFLKAWDYARKKGSSLDSPQAFLFRVARNLTADYYRKKSSGEVLWDDDQFAALGEVVSSRRDSSQSALLSSDMAHIQKCLSQMHKDYADVLTLHFVQDMSIQETAEALEKSEGAVRVMLHRALKELRGKMTKEA